MARNVAFSGSSSALVGGDNTLRAARPAGIVTRRAGAVEGIGVAALSSANVSAWLLTFRLLGMTRSNPFAKFAHTVVVPGTMPASTTVGRSSRYATERAAMLSGSSPSHCAS